jgi:hypothetical protein
MKTNMKRSLIQICLLVTLPLPALVHAQFNYRTDYGTMITITGYIGSGGSVTIPTTINGLLVTSIGEFAFAGTSLTSITIPDSVVYIWGAAFEDCTNLGSVSIGNGVVNIAPYAFDGCYCLTNVALGDSLTKIGYFAFNECISLTNITIPRSVSSIISHAFAGCYRLTSVYFRGDAPVADETVFSIMDMGYAYDATAYYLPGTTGWTNFSANAGILAVPWLPLIQTGDAGFGMRTNQFGFNIAWASGQTVVVEACTNLANPVWSPVATNTLTGDSSYFSDPQWTNYPARFYRLKQH